MTTAPISSSVLSQVANVQRNFQQVRSEFKQLGQDLQSGNLTQAQTDFVTLSKAATTQFGENSSIIKAFNAIGQALQSGNIPAAQQAYSSLPIALVSPNAVPHAHIGSMQGNFDGLLNQLAVGKSSCGTAGVLSRWAAMEPDQSCHHIVEQQRYR
jgi:hypothetical protein